MAAADYNNRSADWKSIPLMVDIFELEKVFCRPHKIYLIFTFFFFFLTTRDRYPVVTLYSPRFCDPRLLKKVFRFCI